MNSYFILFGYISPAPPPVRIELKFGVFVCALFVLQCTLNTIVCTTTPPPLYRGKKVEGISKKNYFLRMFTLPLNFRKYIKLTNPQRKVVGKRSIVQCTAQTKHEPLHSVLLLRFYRSFSKSFLPHPHLIFEISQEGGGINDDCWGTLEHKRSTNDCTKLQLELDRCWWGCSRFSSTPSKFSEYLPKGVVQTMVSGYIGAQTKHKRMHPILARSAVEGVRAKCTHNIHL